MKKLYYYSKTKLQFVEISREMLVKKLLQRPILLVQVIAFSLILVVFGIVLLLGNGSGQNNSQSLNNKLKEITKSYSELDNQLDSLIMLNNELRVAANLPALTSEEQMLGVGGGYFDNLTDFSSKEIKELSRIVDNISRKIQFEKINFSAISSKIDENRKLFEALPAIKPCNGIIAEHGYGMRIHPILKVNQMHDGIDFVADVGTPVYVSGSGRIDFIGYKGGYGLAVEVDHGFGYRTLYAHLSDVNANVGQFVKRGAVIAFTGNTGLSSGPHLHYEVSHNGIKMDPSNFFFEESGNINLVKK